MRKVHTIKMSQICQPKIEGGLRLKNLYDMNITCLFKLVWKLVTGNVNLYVSIYGLKMIEMRIGSLMCKLKTQTQYYGKI